VVALNWPYPSRVIEPVHCQHPLLAETMVANRRSAVLARLFGPTFFFVTTWCSGRTHSKFPQRDRSIPSDEVPNVSSHATW
jgi:hypothetical protein